MYPQQKLHLSGKFDEFHDKLVKQSDLEHRIKIALEALPDIVPLEIQTECKDSSTSDDLRNKADRISVEQRDNTIGLLVAWEHYSKSIAFAQNDSIQLAAAYANRSAVLFNLKKYAESITDIDRTLKLNFSDKFRVKLLQRKVKCLKLLKQGEEDRFEETSPWFKNTELDDNESEEKLEEQIQSILKSMDTEKFEKYDSRIFKVDFERNITIPCASPAITMKYDKNFGRCVVATRDIEVGEVLVVEKPYATLLQPKCIYSHCSHCFKRAWNSIPCPECVYAMYCSENCRDEAWKQYHDVECPIKGIMLNMPMNDLAPFSLKIAILAIRQAKSISKLRKQLHNIDNVKGCLKKSFSEDGLYHSDQYRAIHLLECHENNRLPYEYITVMINVAVILYFVNTLTSFLGNNPDTRIEVLSKNENAIFLGKLMVRHYLSIQMNAHELTEMDHTGLNHGLGSAVFSFCSLFNHSCNPNATRIPVLGEDNNIKLAIVALYPIEKDSQIFDDYGFDFTMLPYAERRENCLHWHFSCRCTACMKKWPTSKQELPSALCLPLHEKKKIQLKEILDTLETYTAIFDEKDFKNLDSQWEEDLKKLADCVKFLYSLSESLPLKELFDAVLLFRQAFLVIHGNRFVL